MVLTDTINAAFEFGSAGMVSINVRKLWHSKQLRGVSFWPGVYFNAWGFWNLFWYPSLGQWISFAGGVSILVVNTTWLALAWKFRNN